MYMQLSNNMFFRWSYQTKCDTAKAHQPSSRQWPPEQGHTVTQYDVITAYASHADGRDANDATSHAPHDGTTTRNACGVY